MYPYTMEVALCKTNDDCMIWLKVAKEILRYDKDLLICTCYALASNSCRSNITCDVFQQLTHVIVDYSHTDDHICIIAGDLNARTLDLDDFCEILNDKEDIYLNLPDDDMDSNLSMCKRFSKDKVMNVNGSYLLQFCKLSGFRILNGRIGEDNRIGKYTYCGSSGRSVVYYMLCKQRDFSYITNCEVLPETIYSDHCQLQLSMKFQMKNISITNNVSINRMLRWDNEKVDAYQNDLAKADDVFVNIFQSVFDNVDGDAIENLVNEFTSALQNVADPLFGKYIKTANHIQPNKCHPARMSDDFLELRTEYYRLFNISRENTDDENSRDMVYMRSKYNAKVRQCKTDYDKTFADKLKNSIASDSKEFWKLLRPHKQNI